MRKVRSTKTIEDRIAEIKATIARLKTEVPPEGESWRDGMIRYYSRILRELLELKNKQSS